MSSSATTVRRARLSRTAMADDRGGWGWLRWLRGDGPRRPTVVVTTLAASALMVASGAIHLHLFTVGFSGLPTIGPLFLLQGIGSIVAALLASALRWAATALLGGAAMLATLAGFLVSVNYGIFGFQDTFVGTNQVAAFVIEIVAAVLFLTAAAVALAPRGRERPRGGAVAEP